MMKKAVIFLLNTALILAAAGCSGASEGNTLKETIVQEQMTEEKETAGEQSASKDGQDEKTVLQNADNAQNQESPESGRSSGESRVLIAYFSIPEDVDISGVDAIAGASIVVRDGQKLGNTEYVAGLIQKTIGGDLFRIETVENYPLDHDPLVDQAADEQDENARPQLASHIENVDQYETILLGTKQHPTCI